MYVIVVLLLVLWENDVVLLDYVLFVYVVWSKNKMFDSLYKVCCLVFFVECVGIGDVSCMFGSYGVVVGFCCYIIFVRWC